MSPGRLSGAERSLAAKRNQRQWVLPRQEVVLWLGASVARMARTAPLAVTVSDLSYHESYTAVTVTRARASYQWATLFERRNHTVINP